MQSKKIGKQTQKFQLIPRRSQYRRQRELQTRPIQRKQRMIPRMMISQKAPMRISAEQKILRVSGLQSNLTNKELFELFSKIGPLNRCNVNYDKLGQSKMTAIIGFQLADDARRAIQEYHGAELDEKRLSVEYADRGLNRNRQTQRQVVVFAPQRRQQRQQQFQQNPSPMRTFRQNKMQWQKY